ncbi:uncharacterized protein LOC109841986 [Asparagus officinalis]|uniref:uncharacterized protein LOC109841986 n=1 Tax=Asparagus officinalis TaxID=4686 RepID=UPI00098E759D|nr:uncharacterized protein LOC109841986 [Asparagus officinalis]
MAITRDLVKKVLFCGAKSFANDLKEGHIWVDVGIEETRRFELDAHFLSHPLFEELLDFSVDEFGYSYGGALRIACDIDLFLHLLELLKSGNPSVHYMELPQLTDRFYVSRGQEAHTGRQLITNEVKSVNVAACNALMDQNLRID